MTPTPFTHLQVPLAQAPLVISWRTKETGCCSLPHPHKGPAPELQCARPRTSPSTKVSSSATRTTAAAMPAHQPPGCSQLRPPEPPPFRHARCSARSPFPHFSDFQSPSLFRYLHGALSDLSLLFLFTLQWFWDELTQLSIGWLLPERSSRTSRMRSSLSSEAHKATGSP